jgi:hypothetical protein
MSEANDLLRSAYSIAIKEGKDTNWEAFENSVRKELMSQAEINDETDYQAILRATSTPRTYRTVDQILHHI